MFTPKMDIGRGVFVIRRVLAVATRTLNKNFKAIQKMEREDVEKDLTFIG